MTDSTQKPGVTDELPTLRQPDPQASSDQAPTPHRPGGKVILAGAAAEDQEPGEKTNVDDPPSVSGLVAGGAPVTRTLPSGDEGDVGTTAPAAKPTSVDADPDGSRPTVVARPEPAAPRAASGSATTLLGVGAVVLATLGVVGYFALRPQPIDQDAGSDDSPKRSKTKASATSKASAAEGVPETTAVSTATPSPTETATPPDATGKPPTPGTAAPSASTSSGFPGVPPPIWPSSTPSWVPTSVPTAIPSVLPPGIPTTFPFPTAPAPTINPPPAPTT